MKSNFEHIVTFIERTTPKYPFMFLILFYDVFITYYDYLTRIFMIFSKCCCYNK